MPHGKVSFAHSHLSEGEWILSRRYKSHPVGSVCVYSPDSLSMFSALSVSWQAGLPLLLRLDYLISIGFDQQATQTGDKREERWEGKGEEK